MAGERLRERHKLKTEEAIVEAALRLFDRQGYDATTIEEIAAAADVAPRTFYRYFPTKEAVVFGNQPAEDRALRELLEQRSRDEPFMATAQRVIAGLLTQLAPALERLARLARLVESTPALQQRGLQIIAGTEQMVTQVLLRGRKSARDRLRAQVVAASTVAAWRVAAVAWLRGEQRGPLERVLEEALALLADGFDRAL